MNRNESLSKIDTSNSTIGFNQSTQSLPPSVHCSPIFVEYQLMKEFILFQKQELLHVYIAPSHRSAFEWFGVMFIHEGLYREKLFRFTLHIHSSYPNCNIPMVVFDPIPIHPLIDELTGCLNLSTKFTKWNSTSNFFFEVIAFVKQVFEINDSSELNRISNFDAKNYDLETLKQSIKKEMIDFNQKVIAKKVDDKNFIDFSEPENPTIINKIKNKLLTEKNLADPSLDGMATKTASNNSTNTNKIFCSPSSTSISGLSWAKKIVYN